MTERKGSVARESIASPADGPELELLRLLEQHPDYSQRQMSAAMGISLGKAHYLLRALLDKGWVKAMNFKRSPQKARYLYVLTPSGMRHRLQLTHAFLARKEREYHQLHAQIAALRAELGAARAPERAGGDSLGELAGLRPHDRHV